MPTIKLKFVGNTGLNNSDSEYNVHTDEYTFSLEMIIDHLREKGFTSELTDVKFIYKGTTIISDKIQFNFTVDDEPIIYIFTRKPEIISEFITHIFTKLKEQKPIHVPHHSVYHAPQITREIIKEEPLPDTPEDVLTSEKIKKINENVIKQFSDPDFMTMMRICIAKPHIVSMVTSYLNTGDIYTEIDDIEEFTYDEEMITLKKYLDELNVMVSDDIIKKTLAHFSGHLNLTLRYLITINIK